MGESITTAKGTTMKLRRAVYVTYVIAALAAIVAYAFNLCGCQDAVVAILGMSVSDAGMMFVCAGLAPFPFDPELTAVVVAYRNGKMIADQVLPRVPVGKQTFKYNKYDKRETMTIPDTYVGRKGQPKQVEFSATEEEASCEGYGLDDAVPQDDIDNAPAGYNPVNIAAEGIAELIALHREKRAADLVFAAGSYATANKVQLSGNDQWNSAHADGDPIPDINTGLDACILRPNIGVIGQAAWTALRTNPYIMKAVNRTAGDSGMATREEVAQLFELDELLVGQGWYNSAKKGQTASIARLWGKHMALLHVDRTVQDVRGRVTATLTAQWGPKFAGAMDDPKIGLRGGKLVRAGEYVAELMTANDLGYFIQDCAA